jgi:hypothetical protein
MRNKCSAQHLRSLGDDRLLEWPDLQLGGGGGGKKIVETPINN